MNSSIGIGAAFSTAGGVGPDENGVVRRAGDLGFLLNTPTPTGGKIGSVPGQGDLLASISVEVVPVPAALPLLLGGLGLLGMLGRCRNRTTA